MDEMKETIRKTIADSLSISESEIEDSTTFFDLGADSLERMELLLALEEEIGESIEDEDAKNINTVNDVMSYLENRS